jgi:hypothetical protein
LARIPEPDHSAIKEARSARRCTYCGCVYSETTRPPRVFGYLEDGVSGEPWLGSSV